MLVECSGLSGCSLFDYLLYVAAVPDNAKRNFLWIKKDGKVYSVDEDGCFRASGPSVFSFQHKSVLAAHVSKRFDDVLKPILQGWAGIFIWLFYCGYCCFDIYKIYFVLIVEYSKQRARVTRLKKTLLLVLLK